jgi:Flp pilus assembly protein TadG
MKRIATSFRRAGGRRFAGDQRGVAAIEFAFISTFMLAMLSGAVDLTHSITIQRDLNRVAAEIAQAVAACGIQSTCANDTRDAIQQRMANIAPQLAGAQLGIATFEKKNDRVENIVGTMTYLPADMNTTAMSMLQNGDKGVAVLLSYTHSPIILGLAQDWGFTTKNFRAPVVTLSVRGGA